MSFILKDLQRCPFLRQIGCLRGLLALVLFGLSLVSQAGAENRCDHLIAPAKKYSSAIADLARGMINLEQAEARADLSPALLKTLAREFSKKEDELKNELGEKQFLEALREARNKILKIDTDFQVTARAKVADAVKQEHELLRSWVPARVVAQGLDQIKSARLSFDNRYLVVASDYNQVRVYNLEANDQPHPFAPHSGILNSAAFSPDGRAILTASNEGGSGLWEAQTGVVLGQFYDHTSAIYSGQFSPDGKLVVLASKDKSASVYGVENRVMVARLQGHTAEVQFASFSPNGEFVVTAAWDGTATIWNTQTAEEVLKLELDKPKARGISKPSATMTAHYSPDGARIVTASLGKGGTVWDASNGKRIFDFKGEDGSALLSAQYSPDGKTILAIGVFGGAQVWSAETGEKLQDLELPNEAILKAEFSPDGQFIITATNSTVRLWKR